MAMQLREPAFHDQLLLNELVILLLNVARGTPERVVPKRRANRVGQTAVH
jgi:hypothetical protein